MDTDKKCNVQIFCQKGSHNIWLGVPTDTRISLDAIKAGGFYFNGNKWLDMQLVIKKKAMSIHVNVENAYSVQQSMI